MELTTVERLLLSIVAAADDGIGADDASPKIVEASRGTGEWLIGPWLPPAYGLMRHAQRLEDLGLLTIEYGMATVAGTSGHDIPIFVITEEGSAMALSL